MSYMDSRDPDFEPCGEMYADEAYDRWRDDEDYNAQRCDRKNAPDGVTVCGHRRDEHDGPNSACGHQYRDNSVCHCSGFVEQGRGISEHERRCMGIAS